MFRLKRQTEAPVLPLPVRRLWTVGASGSIALSSYILVGFCISRVAGAATLVSVLIASLLAVITGIAYVELTQRTRVTGSPYSFCYTYLGELPAFLVGWAVVGECAIGAALMGKAITYYSNFLTGGALVRSLVDCCSLGGVVDTRLWHFFDPVAMSAVIIVGVVCAINSNLACKLNQVMLLVNFITVVVTIICSALEGSKDSWYEPTNGTSIFLPEEYGVLGIFEASGIYMHVFLTLATTATLATQHRGASHTSAISMVVTAIVAIIAFSKTYSVSLLEPYNQLDFYTPVPSFMKNVTDQDFTWVASVNCLGAIMASTAGILSMLVLSANTLEQMVSDGLLWSKLAASKPSVSPAGTTLFTAGVGAIGAAFQEYEGLILCLSSGTFMVFQALLISVMVSRSHASRETALLIVLKFTWLLYFFVSPALVVVTNQFGKLPAQSAVQGVLSGVVLMFLQLAINRQQLGVKVVVVQVSTSLVMGFSSYLMYQLHEWAWFRFFIWSFIGVMIYTLYGYRKSHLGRGIVDLTVVPEEDCVRSLEEGLDNLGFQHELAELGVGRRRTQRSLGGHSYASARSRHKESFHSAREEDVRRQSFRSVQDGGDDRKTSFKSFQESLKSSRAPSEAGAENDSAGWSHPEPALRQRDAPGSFRSVRSDDHGGSFKSVRSVDSPVSTRASEPSEVTLNNRRQHVTTEDKRSNTADSRHVSDSHIPMRPGPARRGSPPTSRRTTAADLMRTPPPAQRRARQPDLVHTAPTPRGRGSVEILINPRRLYEEMYVKAAPPPSPPLNTAPVVSVGQVDTPNKLVERKQLGAAARSAELVRRQDTPNEKRGDESDTSFDSDWEVSSGEHRAYSEVDINFSSMSSSASLSSASTRPAGTDGVSVASLQQKPAAPAGHDREKASQLVGGDLVPVPPGKRSLSYSDISYDDEEHDYPSASHVTSVASEVREREEKKTNIVRAATKDDLSRVTSTESSGDCDSLADEVGRVSYSEDIPNVLVGAVPDICTHSRPSNSSPELSREIVVHAAPQYEVYLRGDSHSSSESVTSEDGVDCRQVERSNVEQAHSPDDEMDRDLILAAKAVSLATQKQSHFSGLSPAQDLVTECPHSDLGFDRTKPGREEKLGSVAVAGGEQCNPVGGESRLEYFNDRAGNRSPANTHESLRDFDFKERSERNPLEGLESDDSSSDGEESDASSNYHFQSDSDVASASPSPTTKSEMSTRPAPIDDGTSGPESVAAHAVVESDDLIAASWDRTPAEQSSDTDTDTPRSPDQAGYTSSDDMSEGGLDADWVDQPDRADQAEKCERRPLVRRQMRLPPLPAEARWLARTPTPPDLLAALRVADGSRLAASRSTSLPSLSSSSDGGNESGARFAPSAQSFEQLSNCDRGDSKERSPTPSRCPERISKFKGDESIKELPTSKKESLQGSNGSSNGGNGGSCDNSSEDEGDDGCPGFQQQPNRLNEVVAHDGTGAAMSPLCRSGDISDSTSDDSPVPLRRAKETSPHPTASRVTSLQAASPEHSPAVRLGSLPPLNPQYRSIYRSVEQPSFGQIAGRWRAVQRARETFIHADEEERAVSFIAPPLDELHEPVELDKLNSSDLQVWPELELRSQRLAANQQVPVSAAGGSELEGPDGVGSAPPSAQDDLGHSPDIVYC